MYYLDLSIGGIVVFYFAIVEYRNNQKWKKSELANELFNKFNTNFNVKRAMYMLDWNKYEIPLIKNEIGNNTKFYFHDVLLESSLKPHTEAKNGFTREEALIRNIMDDFFEQLGLFYIHIKKKLITKEDIDDYIEYWLEIIANPTNNRKNNIVRKEILNYIVFYKYNNVVRLFELFNYNIDISSAELLAKSEMNSRIGVIHDACKIIYNVKYRIVNQFVKVTEDENIIINNNINQLESAIVSGTSDDKINTLKKCLLFEFNKLTEK